MSIERMITMMRLMEDLQSRATGAGFSSGSASVLGGASSGAGSSTKKKDEKSGKGKREYEE
jgi:hypothetical protein